MSDQEGKISLLFKSIENEFSVFERIEDPKKADSKLSLITSMIRDCKGCVITFLYRILLQVQQGTALLMHDCIMNGCGAAVWFV